MAPCNSSSSRPPLSPLVVPPSSSAQLSSPHSPSLASPALSERRPLLRSVPSFNPDALKRNSARISRALFDHHDYGAVPSGEGSDHLDAQGGQDDALVSPAESTMRGRTFTRSRGSFLGTIGGGGSLRRSTLRGYDGDFREQFEKEGGNGVRSWYDNFHGIDWIHDAIKHSARLRRLRRRKQTDGLRGKLANLWDGLQGWLLVSLIGAATACIAFCIISSEMVLFDLKEGYCEKGWTIAKRFCCPAEQVSRVGGGGKGGFVLQGWGAVAGRGEEGCEAWRTWAQVYEDYTGAGAGTGEWAGHIAFVVIAIAFSTLASILTITFTSSTSVYSSKDSPSVPHAGFSPEFAESLATASASRSSSAAEAGGTSKYGAMDDANGAADSDGQGGTVQLMQRPRKTLYFAAGSGIPEIKTILSGFVIRGYLGSWTLAVKAVGLTLSVASGLSLGKEGPFVHIASCVANILSRPFPKYDRNEAKRREIISAGCAAGVAVSFGAPVGGVLFSLEEVSYFFPPRTMLRSFFCAMTAAIVLKMLNPFRSGKIVLFETTFDRDWHALELVGFLGLAVFGGVYGAVFCKLNIWWVKNVRNVYAKSHPVVEVALVTLLTVIISFSSPWTKMGGTELISSLFHECHKLDVPSPLCVSSPSSAYPIMFSLILALLIKAALTVITFGIKLPAGIFIPTLAVGACAGRVAGLAVEVANARWPESVVFGVCHAGRGGGGEGGGPMPFGQACVLPGVWAMIGAAATLAGVTRTTVSLAVIVFELTGTLTYSVPTMLAVLLAKTVADSIEPRSIYDLVIEVADLPYLDAKAEYIHDSTTPSDILDSSAPVISLDKENTVSSLRAQLAALYADGTASGFPLVAADLEARQPASAMESSRLLTTSQPPRRVFGYISSKELEHGLSLASSRGLPDSAPLTFRTASLAARGVSTGSGGTAAPSGAVTPVTGEFGAGGMDLGWLSDAAPVTVNVRSPIELLHEMFSKLGLRGVLVVDERGLYLGSVERNRYLRYLQWLEKRNGGHGGGGGKRDGLESVMEGEREYENGERGVRRVRTRTAEV
ncbi:hypothetical protein JCM8547_009348 [Rhodosporidiobolus lusitaniae]